MSSVVRAQVSPSLLVPTPSCFRLDACSNSDLGALFDPSFYINGREQLCRQRKDLDIAFERSDNKILAVSDFEALATLSEKFNHTDWATFLQRQAVMVNPLLNDIEEAGFNLFISRSALRMS
uniref:Uncharacterized protein n=1 Tax=Candidatus Kentrum sp. TUN TaxID=2126343 RepID=A0A450ZT38_9GAMM|nr:MAG: hypothetical protein BECKTUN1418F_GA0071002_11005 [Candidatus Kentron sp. TUN]VFK61245.1 MAG: hypothetical protein BECKTUN1418D_GA0071000_11473 [Candidatus Kentron sp. TUN]VFK64488.1 MAG: hypothetical protein BECKTUN1418E_GA0071001_10965 [Candidatus Kentron sp. TUN]